MSNSTPDSKIEKKFRRTEDKSSFIRDESEIHEAAGQLEIDGKEDPKQALKNFMEWLAK